MSSAISRRVAWGALLFCAAFAVTAIVISIVSGPVASKDPRTLTGNAEAIPAEGWG